MQKNNIKRKKIIKKHTQTKNYNTKKIKKRVEPKQSKKINNNIKIGIFIGLLLLLIIFYISFGKFITAFTLIGILIILGISKLLEISKKSKIKRRILSIFIILILTLGILGLIGIAAFMMYIAKIAEPQFNTKKLQTSETSIIYANDGSEIVKLGSERREKVTYDQLPEVLIDAIIATEDSRFFQHNGFDAARFIKAAGGQLLGNSDAGGASTLSMQVIKNQITSTEATGVKGIIRKFTDIYLSMFKLEKNYTKQEIIEFYVNNHFLGGNIYGVQEASKTYFGKDVSELNLSEASILAGMFKSPNYYRPNINPDKAESRRKTVLYLMRKHGYITAEEEKLTNSIPVSSLIIENNSNSNQYQGYIDTVLEEVEKKYKIDPYVTPLLIYTNLDKAKQNAVNSVLNGETYSWINDKVQTGVSVLDSQTGKILAIGNGRNKSGAKTWNYATDIDRQPGSTAKPLFDYGPGIEYNNWSTYTLFDDAPYSYSNGRSIKNWDSGYYGTITLRRSLATSRNIPALKAFQQVDNKKIIEYVTNLGIQPEVEGGKIHEAHSIGAFTGVSPLEMSAAYAAFSNGGYYNEPYTVSKIVYRDTDETKEHNSDNYIIKRKAMSEATAYMISSVLQDVALTGGTPKNVACKTGTTNYDDVTMRNKNLPSDAIRDSWVVGYSTKTVIGMWYGYDFIDREYCLRNLPATIQKDRLFNALVSSGAMEANREEFKQPDSVVKLGIVEGSNPPIIANENYTGNVIYEYFKKDAQPEKMQEETLSTPSNLKVTYDGKKTVNISWDAVSPGSSGNEAFGTFGYNVYFNNTLIGFTDKTSFTYTTIEPYGTYKIIATYKSYSGIQSTPATYKLTEKEIKLNSTYTGTTNVNTGDKINFNYIKVTNNNKDITSNISNFKAYIKGTTTPITTFPKSVDGTDITIVFKGTYDGKEYTLIEQTFKIKSTTTTTPPSTSTGTGTSTETH